MSPCSQLGGKETRIKAHPSVATFQNEGFSVLNEKLGNDLDMTEYIGILLSFLNSSKFDQAACY